MAANSSSMALAAIHARSTGTSKTPSMRSHHPAVSLTMRRIDLSHTIEEGMITYKGLPAPVMCDFLSREDSRAHYAPGTEFQIGVIEMVANTGTYIDSPFHRFAEGTDVAGLSLDTLAGVEAIVVRTADERITPAAFAGVDVNGCAVLVHTGFSRHWRTDRYFEGHPYLTSEAAVALRDAGAILVGIDSYNIDDVADSTRPVHTTLLGAGIPIIEHMTNLHALPDTRVRLYAVPPKVRGIGSFPVRAFAEFEEPEGGLQ